MISRLIKLELNIDLNDPTKHETFCKKYLEDLLDSIISLFRSYQIKNIFLQNTRLAMAP